MWGNRRFLPHIERSGSPRRSGRHLAQPNASSPKEKGTFRCPFLLVKMNGREPSTSCMSSRRSDQLSYTFILCRSCRGLVVGVTGFEPATSCSQSMRATSCATPRLSLRTGGCLAFCHVAKTIIPDSRRKIKHLFQKNFRPFLPLTAAGVCDRVKSNPTPAVRKRSTHRDPCREPAAGASPAGSRRGRALRSGDGGLC